jgi:hypothetical protein
MSFKIISKYKIIYEIIVFIYFTKYLFLNFILYIVHKLYFIIMYI